MDPVNEYGPTETQYRGVDQAKDDKPFEESEQVAGGALVASVFLKKMVLQLKSRKPKQ